MDQRDLQRQILQRMRDLGMTPVLPCFAGHVPAAAKRAWPDGTYSTVGVWNNFPSEYADVLVVDPTDKAFRDISAAFMQAQEKIYGLSGYYSCDTFNENDPKSDSAAYLGNASKAVVDGIVSTDPNGVWIMQAWLFSPGHFPWWQQPDRVRRYLEGADRDHFIALDLHAEDESLSIRFNNFYGKASIWCVLHNYGGVRGMYGDLDKIARQPFIDMETDKAMVAKHVADEEENSHSNNNNNGEENNNNNPNNNNDNNNHHYNVNDDHNYNNYHNNNQNNHNYNYRGGVKYFQNLKTTVLGMGFVPESIEQNPILYEIMTENFFGVPQISSQKNKNNNNNSTNNIISDHFLYPASTKTFNTTLWVQSYLSQRYMNGATKFLKEIQNKKQQEDFSASSSSSSSLSESYKSIETSLPSTWNCWDRLLAGFYSSENTPRTELEMVPQIGYELGTWKTGTPKNMFYSFDQLLNAVVAGNEVDPELSAGLHYDAVDIARQAATMYFTDVHVMWIAVGRVLESASQKQAFDKIHAYLLELILKIDDMLGTDKNYLLGVWIQGAKKAASTTPGGKEERDKIEKLFKYNAKNQITMWGPRAQISDYASKSWSGLYKYYYVGRYNVTGNYVREAGGVNRANSWERDSKTLEFEQKWNAESDDDDLYPATPSGKTWKETAVALMNHMAASQDEINEKFSKHDKAISGYPNYDLYREFGSMPLWTTEPRELAKLCLIIEACKGFTSNGFLLSKSVSVDGGSSSEDLWLKK
jgi:hypothetical protein